VFKYNGNTSKFAVKRKGKKYGDMNMSTVLIFVKSCVNDNKVFRIIMNTKFVSLKMQILISRSRHFRYSSFGI
jgi:hypothetical protein